ncbi:MAG: choline/ethanolamine kinase [Ilumatobacteraceae bacterium]|nr:choline/ethanolamine kinase [Ilumatobacteraceae bacterium]
MGAQLVTTLAECLPRIPFLADVDPASARRLAGLTNVNHLVEHAGERFVVRVPGAGTAEYIDRAAEAVAARAASEADVNAEVLFFDASDGLMVTRYVDRAETMSPAAFKDLGAVSRAGIAFRRLHDHSAPFSKDFQLFRMIDEYQALLASKGATLPDGYEATLLQAKAARAALEAKPVPLVASHCDPLCENFLDTGYRMLIIDYEYAGNNEPMWDLGDLSVEGGFSAEQDATLLRAYFNGDPPIEQVARMVIHKAMCDLLWTLWGVIQHVNHNPVDDFWAYAVGRFERCRTLMASPEFAIHIASV